MEANIVVTFTGPLTATVDIVLWSKTCTVRADATVWTHWYGFVSQSRPCYSLANRIGALKGCCRNSRNGSSRGGVETRKKNPSNSASRIWRPLEKGKEGLLLLQLCRSCFFQRVAMNSLYQVDELVKEYLLASVLLDAFLLMPRLSWNLPNLCIPLVSRIYKHIPST